MIWRVADTKPLKFSQNYPKTKPTGSSEFVVRKVSYLGTAGQVLAAMQAVRSAFRRIR